MRATLLIFFLITGLSVSLYAQKADFINIDFTQADSIAALYSNHSLSDLKGLADKLTKSLSTEEERFRAIYRWVCNNIEYDNGLYLKNKRMREKLKNTNELAQWKRHFCAEVFQVLLKRQKTVCTGYAYLIKELATHAGFFCVIVDGYGRTSQSNVRGSGTANHSWNAIKLNNKWYLCDATWSSGVMDMGKGIFIKQFDDSYFLADPALFIRNHYPLDTTWILLNDQSTLHEFLNGPLVYKGAFHYQIHPQSPHSFDITVTKGKSVAFYFQKNNNEILKTIKLLIKTPGKTDLVYPQVIEGDPGNFSMSHVFTQKGRHVVHVMLDEQFVLTYEVKVI